MKWTTDLQVLLQPLKDACDREWKDENPSQIVTIAANAIYWRHHLIAAKNAANDELRKRKWTNPQELIDAAEQLLAWQPHCSKGSSGDLRQKRLRAAIDNLGRDGSLNEAVSVKADLEHPGNDIGGETAEFDKWWKDNTSHTFRLTKEDWRRIWQAALEYERSRQ